MLGGSGGGLPPDGGPSNGDRRSVTGSGTVRYQNIEGGFYGIVSDSGEKFVPGDLGAEFRQDGLRITFAGTTPVETATIYMWGAPLEITSIRAADSPR